MSTGTVAAVPIRRQVGAAEPQELEQFVEHEPVADTAAVATQRVGRIDRRARAAVPRIDPRAGRSAMMEGRAQISPVVTERRNSMITGTCAHLVAGTAHAAYLRELLELAHIGVRVTP
jgi:hypothetical protein